MDSVSGGEVASTTSWVMQFSDPAAGLMQLRLSFTNNAVPDINALMSFSGSPRPFVAIGNTDGFAGAMYSQVSAVPLPAAAWLMLTALGGMVTLGWRRKRTATA